MSSLAQFPVSPIPAKELQGRAKFDAVFANFHVSKPKNPNSFAVAIFSGLLKMSTEEAIKTLVTLCNKYQNNHVFKDRDFALDRRPQSIIPASVCRELDIFLGAEVNCMFTYYLGQVLPTHGIDEFNHNNGLTSTSHVCLAAADYIQEVLFDGETPRSVVQAMEYHKGKFNSLCGEEEFDELQEDFDCGSDYLVPDLIDIANNMVMPPAILMKHVLQMEYNGYDTDAPAKK